MRKQDWDYEYLPGCTMEGDTVGPDGQPNDCGNPRVARVWYFDEDGNCSLEDKDCDFVCQAHLDLMIAAQRRADAEASSEEEEVRE